MAKSFHSSRAAVAGMALPVLIVLSLASDSAMAFTTPHAMMLRTATVSKPYVFGPRAESYSSLYATNSPRKDLPTIDAEVVSEDMAQKAPTDPTPILFTLIQEMTKDRPSAVIATAALALALMMSPLSASAAMSGGRMGGSFSAPSRSMSPSGGYSQSFRSGYGSGYSSGYYSRPSVTIAPFASPFGYSPFYSPFGFPRPLGFGGPGVITYSSGPSILDLIFFGGIAFVIFNAIRSASSGVNLVDVASSWTETASSALGSGTSVVQVSVALDVSNRDDSNSILSVLNRLSKTASTDSRVGIQNLTSQVALELLRRKASIISASTRYKHFNDRNAAQRDFNSLSIKERGKFEQETVSKYGGVDYSSSDSRGGEGGAPSKATVAVVTIMMAIDGDQTKVPKINSIQDVENALRLIASNTKVEDCLQGAEILWTPEDRSETLTLRDIVADYPELRSV